MASSAGGPGDMGGSRSGSASPSRPSGGQTMSGACRSEGLVAGEHVPDGFGEPAGDVDLGDLGAALLAEPALGGLIAGSRSGTVWPNGFERRAEARCPWWVAGGYLRTR